MKCAKKYINNQVKWLKKYTDAEIKSIRKAVKIVDNTSILKFEAQNEWRQQMKDQVNTFASKEYVETLERQIADLQSFKSNLVGKITVGAVIWTVIVILFTWLLKK